MTNFQSRSEAQKSLEIILDRLSDPNGLIHLSSSDLYKVYVLAYLHYPSEEEYRLFLQKFEMCNTSYAQIIGYALVNIYEHKVNFVDSKTPLVDLTESLYVSYSSGRTKTTRLLIASNPHALRGFFWTHEFGRISLLTESDSRIYEATNMDRTSFGKTSTGVSFKVKCAFLKKLFIFSHEKPFAMNLLGRKMFPIFYRTIVNLVLRLFTSKVQVAEEKLGIVFYNQIFMNDYADWNRETLSRIKVLVQETDVTLYFTLHDDIVYKNPTFFTDRRLAEFLSVLDLARTASCVFVPSFAVQRSVAKHFNDNSQIVVLPFAGNHVLANDTNFISRDRSEPKVFLHFLGNDPRKNSFKTFSALLLLAKKGYNFKLNVVGSRTEQSSMVTSVLEELTKIGINQEFFSHLSEEELSMLYQRSDCLLYCSLDEGFGLPIAEAGEIGCAVITSNFGSMLEIGTRYQNVFFVNPDDVLEIEKASAVFLGTDYLRVHKAMQPATTWDNALEVVLRTMGVEQ